MPEIWEIGLPEIEYSEKDRTGTLYVDGEAFFALAGEIHNSVSSDLEYMNKYVWKQLGELPLNTLLVPVHWEQIEKTQGVFDFEIPKKIINQARITEIRIVFLWFGLWKNGASNYVPAWVKRDSRQYFRAVHKSGSPSETVSPFCEKAVEADANAFAHFMKFLKEYDGERHTVIMIQVENEVGFLGSERDFGEIADEKYALEMPESVQQLYRVKGTWSEGFGSEAPEYFMSWYFASALEKIASAGKKEYPLPMFVNVWMDHFPSRAGLYPSGGAIVKTIPIWKEVAKSIDLICPDAYHKDFYGECDAYALPDNPLFISETVRGPKSVSHLLGALGIYHNMLGFSPFGIDDMLSAPLYARLDQKERDALKIDLDWDPCLPENTEYFRCAYELVREVWDLYLEKRNQIIGFIRRTENEDGTVVHMGKYDIFLKYPQNDDSKTGSGGFIIPIDECNFYIIGCNVSISLMAAGNEPGYAEPVGMWEGTFEKGRFIPGRKQNGDRLYQQSCLVDLPSAMKFEVGLYECP